MSDIIVISAKAREKVGKGAARATRREGRIPAVIYGDKQEAEPISLSTREAEKLINTGNFFSTLYEVDVDGNKQRVIPRDVQFDPVKDFPMHVDFLRLGKDARINVEVPVNFLNDEESPGLKRGGVLNVVRYTIELSCPADSIPTGLDADLTGLDIGDSIHISAIALPEGTQPVISDRDFTIATIAAPAAVKSEAEEAEEAAEAAEAAQAAAAEEAEGEEAGDE